MIDRRDEEFRLIQSKYGATEVGPNRGEGLIIKRWALPPGWNKDATQVLVLVPPGYPVTPPDNFYVDHDLRLSSGRRPGNTSEAQSKMGRAWLMFSYHVELSDWKSHSDPLKGHNLLTFLEGVSARLKEAN